MASAAAEPYFSREVIDAARTLKSSERRSLTCFLISSLSAGASTSDPCFTLSEPGCESLIEYPPLTEPPASQRRQVIRSTGKNYTLLVTRLKRRVSKSGRFFDPRVPLKERAMPLLFVTLLALQTGKTIDLSDFDPSCGVKIEEGNREVRVEWPAGPGSARSAIFNLDPSRPLIASLQADGKLLARNVRPLYTLRIGTRVSRPGERYIFFDKPADQKNGPMKTVDAHLERKSIRATSSGRRVRITLGSLTAGVFSGELHVLIYSGSPFLHFEAALGTEEKQVAYIYDFVLDGDWKSVAWKDNQTDQWVRVAPEGAPRPVGVRHRAIFAESDGGSIGVFPAPHAFFYPHDWTTNFKFAQVGKGRFGLRQDVSGGPGHQGAYIPWIDAPSGRTQRLAAFVWLGAESPEAALDRLLRYTHGDAF